MVAQITEGTAFDNHGRPFRRRNFVPSIWLFAILAVITLVVWIVALTRPADDEELAVCNPPPPPANPAEPPPPLGEQMPETAMNDVTPSQLADARVRVLNASGQGGQAADIAAQLRDIGFAKPEAANDPLYAQAKLQCQGQIRFGPGGREAAAAVWLLAPCTELFQDDRTDNTVDLVLGTDFTELNRSDDAEAMLTSLRPGATHTPDLALLSQIHATAC